MPDAGKHPAAMGPTIRAPEFDIRIECQARETRCPSTLSPTIRRRWSPFPVDQTIAE